MKVEESKDFQRLRRWFLRPTPENAVKRVFSTSAALATDIGVGRGENQDRVAIVRLCDFEGDMHVLAVVSDGMGGMQDGAVCAANTLAAFIASFLINSRKGGKCDDWLVDAAFDANRIVNDIYMGKGGATLSALLVRKEGKSFWLNVGDSRIYADLNGELHQLSVDDTIAGQFGDQISSLKSRSDLLQFIGMGRELDPHCSGFYLDEYKSFLLTTDGVHYLRKEIVSDIERNAPDPGVCIKRLVDVAKWSGSRDNCSAAMILVEDLGYLNFSTVENALFEVWDPFGELQFYIEDRPVDNKAEYGKVLDEDSLVSGIKPKVKARNKSALAGKKALTVKKPKGALGVEFLNAVQEAGEEDNPAELSDKKTPQLKISFPRKE